MTNNFIEMCKVYKVFASDWDCDFSEEAMKEMYEFETFGRGDISISGFNASEKMTNGYAVGKKWLNVTVAMWMEEADRHGWHPLLNRIYNDNKFPHWFLDKTFNKYIRMKRDFYMDKNIELNETYNLQVA